MINRFQALKSLSYEEGQMEGLQKDRLVELEVVHKIKEEIRMISSRLGHIEFSYRDPVKIFDQSKVKGVVANLIKVKDMATMTALEILRSWLLEDVQFYCRSCSTKLTTSIRSFKEMPSLNWREAADNWFGTCCCSFGGVSEKLVTKYANSYTCSSGMCLMDATSTVISKDDFIGHKFPDHVSQSQNQNQTHGTNTNELLANKTSLLNGLLGNSFMVTSPYLSKSINWSEISCPNCSCLLGAYPHDNLDGTLNNALLNDTIHLFKCFISTCLPVGTSNDLFRNLNEWATKNQVEDVYMLMTKARNQKVNEKDKPLLSISNFVQVAPNNVLLAVLALLYAINNYLKFTMHGITSMGVSVATGAYILPDGIASMGVPVATSAYICKFIFVIVPSMASVFNEYALKTQYDTSIYPQNLFLYGMEQHLPSEGSLELLLSKVQKLPSSWLAIRYKFIFPLEIIMKV
ncbi:hypothetical protein L2E82_08369 [Cichorium intybus]|uniref:Uncharacterized protein n=1 Tax=Cichorium intybus TaxID=13427 RepID=A0ACB9G5R5_CICIN|nr:hypothetical protein L2E82_08369 [Cichorium intybus]